MSTPLRSLLISSRACLQFLSFKELPVAVSSRDGKAVHACHIQEINRPARKQCVSAHDDHFFAGEGLVEFVFIFAKFLPAMRLHPKRRCR